MRKTKALTIFMSCLVFFASAQHQPATKYAGMISREKLYDHILYLSADSLDGREISGKGHGLAAEYIKNQYAQNSTANPVNSFFQSFKLVKSYWGEIYVRTDNKKYENLKDGIVYLGDANLPTEVAYKMDFIGNVLLNDKNTGSLVYFNTPYWISQARKYSVDHNFSVIIDNTHSSSFDSMAFMMGKMYNASRYSFPSKENSAKSNPKSAFVFSEKTAAEIFNLKPSKLKRIGGYSGQSIKRYREFKPVNLYVKAERRYDTLTVNNVLGYIEGSDKKDEVLVISAHYDHLGIGEGDVYNGADDNASGIAAVLEIARVFNEAKLAGDGPRRSILFIAFTGEEKGLFGSRYYVQSPALPLEKTIANLNIDMIGRADGKKTDNPEYIYLIGSDKLSMDLHNLSEKVNQTYTGLELDYTFNADDDPNRYFYRSDHYNFAKNNITVIFYFNGAHEDYHKPSDTIDKIDFDILRKRTLLIFHTAWELANAENKPRIDK